MFEINSICDLVCGVSRNPLFIEKEIYNHSNENIQILSKNFTRQTSFVYRYYEAVSVCSEDYITHGDL